MDLLEFRNCLSGLRSRTLPSQHCAMHFSPLSFAHQQWKIQEKTGVEIAENKDYIALYYIILYYIICIPLWLVFNPHAVLTLFWQRWGWPAVYMSSPWITWWLCTVSSLGCWWFSFSHFVHSHVFHGNPKPTEAKHTGLFIFALSKSVNFVFKVKKFHLWKSYPIVLQQ